ncbi:MAG TPA: hypothetical protein VGY48_09225 [Vicinamibacterales bacterium]|nr:hypothetical protein [Vicinamibacterales bacterium]
MTWSIVSSSFSSPGRAVRGVASLLCLALCAGCGLLPNLSSPSSPSSNTETFSGALPQQSTVVAGTFTVSQTGTVSVTLVSDSASSAVALGLGIGTPNGTTGCTLTTSTSNAVAGSAAQISVTENSGSYCVALYDVGNLTAAVTYTITVAHP